MKCQKIKEHFFDNEIFYELYKIKIVDLEIC